MSGTAGLARLHGELSLHEGSVPAELDQPLGATPTYQIGGDAFLLSLPMGLSFHYRRGVGTAFSRPPAVADTVVNLFFEGSVFGAIAWLNGYVPLHASAVLHDGRVHAFTGASGEGKSTLAAALVRQGMALWSDDVLVLDVEDPTTILALPGPPRMKLWDDALALTGHQAGARVRPGIDKFYVAGAPPTVREPLPLHRLYFLESEDDRETGIAEIGGLAAFNRLRSAYYRPQFFRAFAGQDHYFQTAMRLGGGLNLARFNRSRERSAFEAGVAMIAADIRAAV